MSLHSFSILSRKRRLDEVLATLAAAIIAGISIVAAEPPNRHVPVDAWMCHGRLCRTVALLIWDGDSFIVRSDGAGQEKIRIENIDAPEIDGRCAEERSAALRAKMLLVRQLQGKTINLSRGRLDRYRRQLAFVIVDGRDVGETLIERGAVRRWDGRRTSWCGM